MFVVDWCADDVATQTHTLVHVYTYVVLEYDTVSLSLLSLRHVYVSGPVSGRRRMRAVQASWLMKAARLLHLGWFNDAGSRPVAGVEARGPNQVYVRCDGRRMVIEPR